MQYSNLKYVFMIIYMYLFLTLYLSTLIDICINFNFKQINI